MWDAGVGFAAILSIVGQQSAHKQGVGGLAPPQPPSHVRPAEGGMGIKAKARVPALTPMLPAGLGGLTCDPWEHS